MKKEIIFEFPEKIILWLYFCQLNGFLINGVEKNFTIQQENQYLFTILDYANFIKPLSEFLNLENMAVLLIVQLIILYAGNFTLMLLKQVKISICYQKVKVVCNYFILFNWIMVSPFQTVFAMVSRKNEFIHNSISDLNANKQIFFLIISIFGTIIITTTSLLSNFIFQKREINQGMLLKYNFKLNYFIGPLTQLFIIMTYLLQDQSLQIITHIQHLILMFIHLIIALQFPFGLTSTSLQYNQLIILSISFNFLIFIWQYFSHNDQFIFLSFFIIGMLLWYSVDLIFQRRIDKIIHNFCKKRDTSHLAEVLEYFIQTHSYTLKHLLQLNVHRVHCQDLLCPCQDCQLLVIDNISIVQLVKKQQRKKKFFIQKWIMHQYKTYLLKTELTKKQQNLLILNYLSFQRIFLENYVLICKTIYQCIEQTEKVKTEMYNVTQTLLYVIQQNCKQQLIMQTLQQVKITQQEFIIITDINIMYELADKIILHLSKVIQNQIQLWEKYLRNEIKNFDQLLEIINSIKEQKQKCQDLFELYQNFRNQTKENIYSLRQDLIQMTKIQSQLMQLEDAQQFDLNLNDFNNLSFLTGQALSIISNISSENQGKLEQQITKEFNQFFGYNKDEKKLTHIKQLMPSKFAEVHSGLVENFFFKGQSDRINNASVAFILNSKNLIEQIKLCLSYFFPVNLRDTSFYMIAHVQKTSKQEQGIHDENLTGYFLIDKEFNIFGMTQNIYEKLNYRYYFKNDANANLMPPQQFYDDHNIFSLIPSFQQKLQNYYERQPNETLRDNDVILIKERGLLKLDFQKQEQEPSASKQFNTKFSFAKFTNKHILNQMLDKSTELFQNSENIKYFPIEYTVTQKILHAYNVNNKIDPFLYYLIEIEMLEDFKKISELNISTNKFLKANNNKKQQSSQQLETQRQTTAQLLQFESINFITSDHLISQNGDKKAFLKESPLEKQQQQQKIQSKGLIPIQNNAQVKKSSIMNIPKKVHNFVEFLQTHNYPSIFHGMIGLIIIHFLVVVFYITITAILFEQKKDIQSNCIIYTFSDVDYFNGFSLILSGSRHTIYNSNYLNILEPLILKVDNQAFKLTSKDCIVISWHLLMSGQYDLVGKYENYSKILIGYEQKQIPYYFPDYSNSKIQSQMLLDQAAYYNAIILSLNAYLSGGNDNIFLVRQRYILYFNYQDAIELTGDSIQSCYDYNNDANKYFDSFTQIWFINMYVVAILLLIFHIATLLKIKKVIQIYLKQFIQVDYEESQIIVKQFENMLQTLKQENILLKYQEFEAIKQIPQNVLQVLQQQETKTTLSDENENNNNRKKRVTSINAKKLSFANPSFSIRKSLLLYIFLMFLKISFLVVFEIYYEYLSSGIAPAAKRELESQQMRLDFIMTINMWDTYILKSFYNATQHIANTSSKFNYKNQNILNNQKLFNLLEIDKQYLLEKVKVIQAYDLTDFLYHNQDEQNSNLLISESNKQILLGQDVCQLTNCNMKNDLFHDRPYTEQLIDYYQVGLIQLFKNVLQVITEHNYLITDDSLTPEQKVQGIAQMYQSFNYFIYVFYGLDATQYQIAQFCKYFLDQTLNQLEYLTSSDIAYILSFGILLMIITFIGEFYIIIHYFNKFELAKESIRQIPLETLFQKGIPKKLNNIMMKYK
ncbi:unnamed protein product (macronuclear) [Paramecium tetraurelia]|uniref:Transmembrane protein n=1 Tax=Paramecium tetraurelia TaxID=5888 RepID=A0D0T8_PARTE|nr:uncharacterized protein GSPATT00012207001 [Paramecium tetraurelia]CAK76655.1 unnamed protein product [Paramecium tetraurelia]|eukprot:XP_001444052.1 hypothetical protein (macronuclear) [Paramecium tetraurelia strain d4-2]